MKVVLIIGGAVSGSTAVKKLTDEGIRCVVVEQNRMPYGKIEDGLPRWHEKQRINEYFKIDDIISLLMQKLTQDTNTEFIEETVSVCGIDAKTNSFNFLKF